MSTPATPIAAPSAALRDQPRPPLRRRLLLALALLPAFAVHPVRAAATTLASITRSDASAALKEALSRGTRAAVAQLSARDGFFADARVRVPLPEQVQRSEKTLRRFGLGRYVDRLSETMNRAAETAVAEATPLLADSLRKMTLADAKSILAGADDAATQHFRRSSGQALQARFLPVVERATEKVALTAQYEALAGRAARFGLIDAADADLDAWVTAKTLDGLWLVLADQERAIRKDPVATGSTLLKKVFGAPQ